MISHQLRMGGQVLFGVVPDCCIQEKWTWTNSKDDSCKISIVESRLCLLWCNSPIGSIECLNPFPPLRSWGRPSRYQLLMQSGTNGTLLKCPGSSDWVLAQWVGSCSTRVYYLFLQRHHRLYVAWLCLHHYWQSHSGTSIVKVAELTSTTGASSTIPFTICSWIRWL